MSNEPIPGYDRGDEDLPAPPITMDEFDQLKRSVMFTVVTSKITGTIRVIHITSKAGAPMESRSVTPAR
ncbi:hypothetical protein V5735_20025 [Haladaptatus sp. SPP-AMP-3]|uniref:hypothetical protein n=1 Tax=Haladaptatus sp. SPP-AMP-3 TaxID=3121295 RepID=UPI003C2F13A0